MTKAIPAHLESLKGLLKNLQEGDYKVTDDILREAFRRGDDGLLAWVHELAIDKMSEFQGLLENWERVEDAAYHMLTNEIEDLDEVLPVFREED